MTKRFVLPVWIGIGLLLLSGSSRAATVSDAGARSSTIAITIPPGDATEVAFAAMPASECAFRLNRTSGCGVAAVLQPGGGGGQ